MRLREEVIFLTLFNISSKSRLSLDNFASIAALCLTGATEFHDKMTLALWQKIGTDCCGLKEQEVTMLYNLFEATLACGIRGVIRSLPTVHRFVVFLFCIIFRHSILSKKSTMATDDAWPLSMNGEDLDSLIKSYFSLNINILIAALCLTPEAIQAGAVNGTNVVLTKDAVESLDMLLQVEVSQQEDFVDSFCAFFEVSVGDPVLTVARSVSHFFDITTYACANVVFSSTPDPIRSYQPQLSSSSSNVLATSSASSTPTLDTKTQVSAPASPALAPGSIQSRSETSTPASGTPTYEYDERHNHIRIRNLSKAGIGVFAAATRTPPTAIIANCANCTIFLIAPCSHVVIANCRNVKIVLGTVAGTISMCYCMRMTLSAIGDFFKANTIENCLMYITSRNSCVHDSNTKTNKIAPYNYIFPSLEDCLQQQGLTSVCQQGESFGMKLYSPLGLGVCENLIFMDPKTYCTAVVPFDSRLLTGKTKALPIILPSVFRQTMKERSEKLTMLGKKIRDPAVTAEQKAAFEAYCKSAFVSWVKANMLTTELLEITTARMYELE
ncbi:Tubulin binding cofactor C family protein [Giardia duodenalis]|uniref:C-CAP/cofactor C-like domain-containing protein n=2 Tax=Giardia intestinalis TaxID=5741 RepID=C6LUV3_GIAIB|nr:Hypothetical protein GL50581_2555 [Giardia intestinalis ATCC 50581]ESU44519.1 Tubulin binding cofactor C family protein [Giardia intestinalis]